MAGHEARGGNEVVVEKPHKSALGGPEAHVAGRRQPPVGLPVHPNRDAPSLRLHRLLGTVGRTVEDDHHVETTAKLAHVGKLTVEASEETEKWLASLV
jgi:hypothetical protein